MSSSSHPGATSRFPRACSSRELTPCSGAAAAHPIVEDPLCKTTPTQPCAPSSTDYGPGNLSEISPGHGARRPGDP
jgi:hypothetical protein